MGGSRPAMESFIEFRGRPPRIDALLRHHGMTKVFSNSGMSLERTAVGVAKRVDLLIGEAV